MIAKIYKKITIVKKLQLITGMNPVTIIKEII
jgi:hypothetical protein